jgi:uncharacterized protein
MLLVEIYRNKSKKIWCYKAIGHCDFHEWGTDIVCASTSTLLQVAILGLSEYCEIKPSIDISEGNLSCIIPDIANPQAQRDSEVILETMLLGLKEIERQYPENVKINEIER